MKFNIVRDYEIVSPSLEGVFRHDLLEYGGVVRPENIFRVFDGPAPKKKKTEMNDYEYQTLSNYFGDLYSLFINKISAWSITAENDEKESVKLVAMLQELIKVKWMIGKRD